MLREILGYFLLFFILVLKKYPQIHKQLTSMQTPESSSVLCMYQHEKDTNGVRLKINK